MRRKRTAGHGSGCIAGPRRLRMHDGDSGQVAAGVHLAVGPGLLLAVMSMTAATSLTCNAGEVLCGALMAAEIGLRRLLQVVGVACGAHRARRSDDLVRGPLSVPRSLQVCMTSIHALWQIAESSTDWQACSAIAVYRTDRLVRRTIAALHLAGGSMGCDRNPQRRPRRPFTTRRPDAGARPAPSLGGVGRDMASWCVVVGREAAADTVAATGDVGSAVTSAAAELSGSPSAAACSAAGTPASTCGAASGDRRSTCGGKAANASAPQGASLRLIGRSPGGGREAAVQAAPDHPGTCAAQTCEHEVRSGRSKCHPPQRSGARRSVYGRLRI